MKEETVFFAGEGLRLEGRLLRQPGSRAVVVTHPHPLYGGDMHNHVVAALVRVYREAGYTTLRFNFRGVGQSEGAYGEGIAEQTDVRAALDLLKVEKKTGLHLAGYSFGAWVIAHGLERFSEVERAVLVSPPAAFMDFSGLKEHPAIRLVITGDQDEIAPAALLRRLVPLWNPNASLEVIHSSDHFYAGGLAELERVLGGFLEDVATRLDPGPGVVK